MYCWLGAKMTPRQNLVNNLCQIAWLTRYPTSICFSKALPPIRNHTLFTILSSRELSNDPCWLLINVLTLSHFINLANTRYYVSLSEIFSHAPSLCGGDTGAEDWHLLPHVQVSDSLMIIWWHWWILIPDTCHHRLDSELRLRRPRWDGWPRAILERCPSS